MEGIFLLEGLSDIISGLRPRPAGSASASASTSTGTRSRTVTAGGHSDDREIDRWLADAQRASVILELSVADDQKFLLQEISRDNPHARWTHLEKQFLPDTALETARLYCHLVEIKPRENESPDSIITRVTKARAAIIETAQESEISSEILLGAFILNLISVNNTDLVKIVYSTRGEKPLTFKEASDSITRLVGSRREDSPDSTSKALAARSGNNKVEKRQNNKKRPKCSHCKKPGQNEEKCWLKHPELAPEDFQKQVTDEKKKNPIRASVCQALRVFHKDSENPEGWFMDSGANRYMTHDRALLKDFQSFSRPKEIELGDNSIIYSYGHGTVTLPVGQRHTTSTITLRKVLYAPKLGINLISVRDIAKEFGSVTFDANNCVISNRSGIPLATASFSTKHGLYQVNLTERTVVATASASDDGTAVTPTKRSQDDSGNEIRMTTESCTRRATSQLKSVLDWHRRLGHVGAASIKLMARQSLADGLSVHSVDGNINCESCILTKQTFMHHRTPSKPTSEPLELIHLDVNGPWNTPSLPRSQAGEINPIPAGSIYSLVLVDDFTGMSWVYFYATKAQFYERFTEFKNMVEMQTGKRIKRMRSDQPKEFHSGRVSTLMQKSGIVFEASAIYTHEQNGKAERMNRTISDMARTMMVEACLPETMWAEAFQTACYIRDRMISRSSRNPPTTPHEAFHGKKPNLEHIRPFGCLAYVTRSHELRQKLITPMAAYKAIFLVTQNPRTSIGCGIFGVAIYNWYVTLRSMKTSSLRPTPSP
jgi:transposase InsO family protein